MMIIRERFYKNEYKKLSSIFKLVKFSPTKQGDHSILSYTQDGDEQIARGYGVLPIPAYTEGFLYNFCDYVVDQSIVSTLKHLPS
jgi:hypothetical protein